MTIEAQRETSGDGVEMVAEAMLIANPGYECLLKYSRYTDPGLQLASPQNNLAGTVARIRAKGRWDRVK
jgi:hypothetical protein